MYIRINNASPGALGFYKTRGITTRHTQGPESAEAWFFPGNRIEFPNIKACGPPKRTAVSEYLHRLCDVTAGLEFRYTVKLVWLLESEMF